MTQTIYLENSEATVTIHYDAEIAFIIKDHIVIYYFSNQERKVRSTRRVAGISFPSALKWFH